MSLSISLAIILGAMVIGSVVVVIIARRSPEGGLADRVPTNIYAVTAGAMSLLTAFTFAAAFTMYTTVRNDFHTEASSVLTLYRETKAMEEPTRSQLQNEVRCYAHLVSTVEWQQLQEDGVTFMGPALETFDGMDAVLATPAGQAQAGESLSGFEAAESALLVARQQRIAAADWGVPLIVYVMILLGALITIGSLLLYADAAKPAWGHALLIIGPVFVVAASLIVIYFFDNPFTESPGGVTPRAMITTSQYIDADLAQLGPVPPLDCPSGSMPSG